MNARPPLLATWLLTHFTSDGRSESLIGDLIEQYRGGRSSAWYWRQAVTAIGGGFVVQAWLQKWLVIGVVGLNLFLPYAYRHFVSHWVTIVDRAWYPRFINWLLKTHLDLTWRMTHRFHLWALTGTVVWCALLALVAWALVRSFPRHRGLVLTVFLFSSVGQCMPHLRVAFVDWVRDPGNPIWFFNVLCFATFAFIATPFSILWGGGAARTS
jgi:hypothetical protein